MEQISTISAIAEDTLKGLSAKPRYLLPRYFYDEIGSRIFQDIMQMPEYYLTASEYEIVTRNSGDIANLFAASGDAFDLVELGAGDGIKTQIIIDQLISNNFSFNYLPVDISANINNELSKRLKDIYPSLNVMPITGDYFHLVDKLKAVSDKRKVIMFLGSNIGNFSNRETTMFLRNMNSITESGDRLFIGFDLKKSPEIILSAYNDKYGHTRNFNLNLLSRLNREMDANFNLDGFEHHTDYNPVSGDVKSFLVSRFAQQVNIPLIDLKIELKRWEPIFMERSRKFDLETIEYLAETHGFRVEKNFTDSKNYFVDSVWIKE
jgi:dimethylhistidine N-methyltransferase